MNQPETEALARVYTLPEVARILKVSVPTLRGWRYAGKMQCIRLPGGTLRVKREELERLAGGPIA